MEIKNEEIFNLIKNQEFEEIYNIIKNNKITNLDIKDTNYNYFIHYIVNYNKYEILELILKLVEKGQINIRLDILDTDKRTLLYNCIKFNYIEMIKLLIEFNKISIGITIINAKDNLGLTALYYSIIFNNFEAFKLLLENGSDVYSISKDGNNAFTLTIIYNRMEMFNYLLEKNYNINFINLNGENILQIAVNYQNKYITNKLLQYNINLNNVSFDYGISIFHQSIIQDNFELFNKLLEKNIDINLPDFYGNTPLHYILLDKRIKYLEPLFKKDGIKFNVSNINGELPLHVLLESDVSDINDNILNKIILETDLNVQNNDGITCLMLIIQNNLIEQFYDLLVIKPLNFYIEDNNSEHMKITDEILTLMTESYYNQIKVNKDKLLIDWELWCSKDNYDKLKTLITNKTMKSEEICKKKIKEVILKEKRSLPKMTKINLVFDNGIFTNVCFYTGSTIDILFGLIFLNNEFASKKLSIILDFPLTINTNLENYYKKLGIDYPYKLDFSNIEIIWSYQKIFYPSYFDDEIKNKIKVSDYIVIPIGIELSLGSHANILLWDVKNRTIERFEPNGSNYPIGYNYNPSLLDSLLENKFKSFDNKIEYFPPKKFLPAISFQILENLETTKCKKIGDPNGFCAVWCIWWIYQRIINIDIKMKIENIADELIKNIKFDNKSFKTIIRNFSKNITEIRDNNLKKYNLDINDWITGNYTEEILNNIEKDIHRNIK